MAEFSAAAELDITVPQSELRSARSQIERELGDVEVGVSGRTAAPDGGVEGSEAAMIEIQRRTLVAQRDSADFDEERNEILREMLNEIRESSISGRRGGGSITSQVLQFQGARSILGKLGGGAGLGGLAGLGGAAGLAGRFGRFGGPLAVGGLGAMLSRQFFPVEGLREASGFSPDKPVLDQISITPEDLIGQSYSPIAADLIDRPARITPEDIMQAPPAGAAGRREVSEAQFSTSVDVTNNVQVSASLQQSERQRFEQAASKQEVESLVQSEIQRFEQRLRDQFQRGGGTGGGRLR